MPHTYIKMLNHLKAHISYHNESCRKIPSVNPKSNKCAVPLFSSSKCLNIITEPHLFHLFTQWPVYIF